MANGPCQESEKAKGKRAPSVEPSIEISSTTDQTIERTIEVSCLIHMNDSAWSASTGVRAVRSQLDKSRDAFGCRGPAGKGIKSRPASRKGPRYPHCCCVVHLSPCHQELAMSLSQDTPSEVRHHSRLHSATTFRSRYLLPFSPTDFDLRFDTLRRLFDLFDRHVVPSSRPVQSY